MLGDISPHKAAKTAKGRAKIASWLKFLENRTAQQDPGDPMAATTHMARGKSSVLPICANDQFAAGEQRELAVVLQPRVPLVRLEDGRPFGADLPVAAPGVAKRGQGWPKATAGGGASVASGLEGASWPVFCGQVRAEGPLRELGSQPQGWPYPRRSRANYRLGLSVLL